MSFRLATPPRLWPYLRRLANQTHACVRTSDPVGIANMAELALRLLRMIARAFYQTEHIIVIDALCFHSTLSDMDLAHLLSMQIKPLRKIAGRLREDGLLSVQTRTERRTDGSGGFYSGGPGQAGKERVTHRDWYYINFHRAIDCIKYRMWKLSKHVESIGAPMTERKELVCPRCKSQYTELEVMDSIDPMTGDFLCHRCSHALDRVKEEEGVNENESMKRLNSQLEPLLILMRQIDSTSVPENDFDAALAKHRPIQRTEVNPSARTEIVDLPHSNLASTKGLDIKPERIAVQVQEGDDVKRETDAEEARRRKEKEARQNALPEWISKSTVTGDITAVGAKEERLKRERDVHSGLPAKEDEGEDKKAASAGDEDVMNAYWAELEKQRVKEAAAAQAEKEEEEEEEDDDDDEDGFEDVKFSNGNAAAPSGAPSTGFSTPGAGTGMDSSNATDDERETKRARLDGPTNIPPTNKSGTATKDELVMSGANGAAPAEGTPAQSDEDGDEEGDEELQFENV